MPKARWISRFWRSVCAALFALLTAAAPANAAAEAIKRPTDWKEIDDRLRRDHSFALVIGITEFDHGRRLQGIAAEVTAVSKAFADQGFKITMPVTDGRMTKTQLAAEINGFLKRYGGRAENRLIIYFATHGYAAKDKRDFGFLIASDTLSTDDKDFEGTAYSVRELSQALTGISAQHVYLFFNSCFSGAMMPEPTRDSVPFDVAAKRAKALSPEMERWIIDLLVHNARLVLTAGSDGQTVPDVDNPYARGLTDGLGGEADADGDGLILGTELAQYMRGRVARETRRKDKPNDAVFAILPKVEAPAEESPDVAEAPARIDYALQGDFVFLSPRGPRDATGQEQSEVAAVLEARRQRLPPGQFVECADCPVMVDLPDSKIAIARTETTFAEWDACYREYGCRRYLPDDGHGRGDRPAGGLTWQDALEFGTWLTTKKGDRCERYRLPTRAEWLAATHQDEGEVSATAELGEAICRGCGPGHDEGHALAVASLPADSFGLHDLAGNVWEWVDEKPACDFAELRQNGRCTKDGTVMGGSFATAADRLSLELEGTLPRTSNEEPWSWPTVGMRIACEKK
jgi:hypothetical protein